MYGETGKTERWQKIYDTMPHVVSDVAVFFYPVPSHLSASVSLCACLKNKPAA
jgi:hypothetical protein